MTATSFRDCVETIRNAADIADVIGESVKLQRAGRQMKGLCPFHQEKTPSFHVDPAKQLYYCHGCGSGGDVFKFVMTLHGMDFSEAVGLLADRYGIPRPARGGGGDRDADHARREALRALAAAQEHFEAELAGPKGEPARDYLARRGYSMERALEFGMGFAPPGWDGLLVEMARRNIQQPALLYAGLVVERRGGGGVYDRYRNRITFPIRDSAGRIVSFGGRAMEGEEPKYLNGPETRVYDKSRTLFRLHETSREIRQSERAVVVEGYFDALGLAAAGVPGVVAVCGTSLGEGHARLLKRWTETIVLILDGDAAGRKAVHRALGPLLAGGLAVRVAFPPEGRDPDDVAREEGPEAVEAMIERALDLPGFLVEESRRAFDVDSLEGQVKALEASLYHIVALESPVARDQAAMRVADGLGVNSDLVRDELARVARKRERELSGARRRRAEPVGRKAPFTAAEATVLRYLGSATHENEAAIGEFAAHIPFEALGAPARRVAEAWTSAFNQGEARSLARMAELAPEELQDAVRALAFAGGPDPEEREARGALASLEEGALKRRLQEVQARIEAGAQPDDLEQLMSEKFEIARRMHELASPESGDRP